jgi:hypothetical protein
VDSGAPTDVHAHARRNADTDADVRLVAETYLRLQQELPGVDVQIVGVDNTAYLLPTVFRALRARYGVVAAVRGLNRATTAGAVLVDRGVRGPSHDARGGRRDRGDPRPMPGAVIAPILGPACDATDRRGD